MDILSVALFIIVIVASPFIACYVLSHYAGQIPTKSPQSDDFQVLILLILTLPLLPFVLNKRGHFRYAVFRRKWLFWPLTRARRLSLQIYHYNYTRWLTQTNSNSSKYPYGVFYIDASSKKNKGQWLPEPPPLKYTHGNTAACTRFVTISDTHLLHQDLQPLPPGHVLIHCGDILVENHQMTSDLSHEESFDGTSLCDDKELHCHALESTTRAQAVLAELKQFNEWLSVQPFQHKLVIAGNHDGIIQALGPRQTQALLSSSVYLPQSGHTHIPLPSCGSTQDSLEDLGTSKANNNHLLRSYCSCNLNGLNGGLNVHSTSQCSQGVRKSRDQRECKSLCIYGSSMSRGIPDSRNKAFQYTLDEQANELLKTVGEKPVDVLVTHGPPKGILDQGKGCQVLREWVLKNKPRVHVFGHQHECHGITWVDDVLFINSSSVDFDYAIMNPPIVFDL